MQEASLKKVFNTYRNVVLFSCYVLINSVFLLRQELNCCLAQALQAVFPLIGTLIIITVDEHKVNF